MAVFKKKNGKELAALSTASLPDIVFMLLFFFMVSTTMREVTLNVEIKYPEATQLSKLEKKSLVTFIYAGPPVKQLRHQFGKEAQIQLNDRFASASEIQSYIATEREKMKEADRPKMTVSLKVDKTTRMLTVTEIKQALRKAQALKINYSARSK